MASDDLVGLNHKEQVKQRLRNGTSDRLMLTHSSSPLNSGRNTMVEINSVYMLSRQTSEMAPSEPSLMALIWGSQFSLFQPLELGRDDTMGLVWFVLNFASFSSITCNPFS